MVLRVGIVSAGWAAFAHLPAWRAIEGVEVTAICTSRRETAEAAQARLGLPRAFWDAEAMCADPAIDIVDLGTRPSVRLPMVLAAIRHGKHIYNGCPHAPDWAGAKAIMAEMVGASTIGVVDAFSEHLPVHRHMRAMLESGFLGEPLAGQCYFNLSLFNQPDKRFPYGWFADGKAGVSALRNHGSHMLHVLTRLFGPVEELVGDDTQLLHQWVYPDGDIVHPETNDLANVILVFGSGLRMTMQVGWNMPLASGWMIDVHGTEGRLRAESPSFPTARDAVLSGGRIGDKMEPITLPDAYLHDSRIRLDWQAEIQPSFPMALTMQGLVDEIDGIGRPAPDFARAHEVERLLEAIRVSSTTRRWVRPGAIEAEKA